MCVCVCVFVCACVCVCLRLDLVVPPLLGQVRELQPCAPYRDVILFCTHLPIEAHVHTNHNTEGGFTYPPSGPKLPGRGEQDDSHMQHMLHVVEQDGLFLMSSQAP